MAAIFAFKCRCCGRLHEGSPSVAFSSPWHYHGLTDADKKALGRLDSDFCTITYPDQTDLFIRAMLEVPIHGTEDPFSWGVWVSLSAKSFMRYEETYNAPVEGDGFYGTLCNELPNYPNTVGLPADVRVQLGNRRPLVFLHQPEHGEPHPLVLDQLHGISVERAQHLGEITSHGT